MTPREVADEAREAWSRQPRRTAEENIQRMVDAGRIELLGNGEVRVLFGDESGDEAAPAPSQKKRRKGKKPTQ